MILYDQGKSNNKRSIISFLTYIFQRSTGTRYISFFTDTASMGIRLAGGDKHGLFICEVQSNSVAQKAGLLVADKLFSVSSSLILLNEKKNILE